VWASEAIPIQAGINTPMVMKSTIPVNAIDAVVGALFLKKNCLISVN
jgi:hypothetical protein